MNGWKLLLAWEFHPSVVIGCVVLLAVYLYFVRFKWTITTINFVLGVLTIFVALESPLDPLGDDYLFSAHMTQHMLLALVAAPLLVAGIPESFARAWLRYPILRVPERILSNPLLALIIGTGVFWIWHHPTLFDATLENETIHIFEHLTLLASGVIMFWPVFKPIPEGRMSRLAAVAYLLIASSIDGLLGIIFSLSETVFYAGYLHPEDELGALHLLRDEWGLDPLNDQRLGGSVMWGLGSIVFLWAMMAAVVDWFLESEEEEVAEGRIDNVAAE